ncbi:sulfite exporter TauE/SafE family protein [Rhodoblastus acidophilus]|uniref:Probable membrane transporter protein n=1 Tax=Candidatus Rhodoblastus alkanivorans TaxID=2954117 RepID=A0ABS9ZCD1_9HYPH|nr:sulfite exporter TauE/SafE family protein [Candidatus Rhodoblastus alkanivorans]MCI4680011.1 sulfite exporter TauE/SafE family protein [Candidatus Rhodoblastus alkanivorans]MCI4684247.1 sulfite exporter TauE/SafE family protein [Candidatus Rhodoblastus alkanivorans]MDI4641567.1 sulfite exporter TauE/SafE family protein [Rhodoblastus acidophilus]
MNDVLLIAGAGFVGGTMNAIAGGGSFVTLPALITAGVPALNANASSTVALVPSALASAYAYRKDFQGLEGVRFRDMALLSVAGGAAGALLLEFTPQDVFKILVPFLLLFGTLAFAFGRNAGVFLRERIHITPRMLLISQFVLGVYGGYFGGAVGVMMLAAWSLMTSASIAAMQPARNLLNAAMNATATLLFVIGGLIYWRETFILFVGAILGGYFGAYYARKIDPSLARIVISGLNAAMTAYIFWRTFGH